MLEKQAGPVKCFLGMIGLCCILAIGAAMASSAVAIDANEYIELARYELEYSKVHIAPAKLDQAMGLAIIFSGTDKLHYYADATSGVELKVTAVSKSFSFGKALFPQSIAITDPLGSRVQVYQGNFTVFIPIQNSTTEYLSTSDVDVTIIGQACTSELCLMPFEKSLSTQIDLSSRESWMQISLDDARLRRETSDEGRAASFGLAFLAGLILNLMPCVWPVLPIIVMRIVSQAKQSRRISIAMGFSFCVGILLFFAILAGANIVLRLFYSSALQWGDQFRSPTIVAGMSLLLVLLAMSMFDIFTITVPSAVSNKQSTGGSFSSSIGMGFLAAVLSTPCSFGILAAAFAWAQSQPLLNSTIAIMCIGLGMALPYAILTSMPGLLRRLPAPGRWMELFKQGVGFILLVIAVKLIAVLPAERIHGILYFAVVLAFCAWMWGKWVDFSTKPAKKWLVRLMAVALVLIAGWTFLPAQSAELIDWQDYNTTISDLKSQILDSTQPVLIKFTANWCLSCQVVEKTVFSRKDIADLIKQKGVLAIKADTTEKDFPATKALQEIYHEPGVPVTMLFIPGQNEPVKWRGLTFAGQLKQELEKLPDINRGE
jgi:thiol:disulfide interchange protein